VDGAGAGAQLLQDGDAAAMSFRHGRDALDEVLDEINLIETARLV
jgi:hypothetical protein